jgi:L-threonylcarbamoyladenylate synthase
MQTEILKITDENKNEILHTAANVIQEGGLVVFPTETVYGLGADAFNEEAVKKIFSAKGRPSDNPIIVHISNPAQLQDLVKNVSAIEQKLIDSFWPGPLTIIFKKKDSISTIVSGGLSTVAVRMPSHPIARELILKAGVPIAAPSANTSGRPSSTSGADAYSDLVGKVDMIIDTGPSDIGVESTVVKVINDSVSILRPGAVTEEMLSKVVSPLPVIVSKGKNSLQASPGTKYKHYAPAAPLEIVPLEYIENRATALRAKGKKVGILFQNEKNLEKISKNLYRALRYFDTHPVDIILVPRFPEDGLGRAIMDRLERASGAGN